MKIKESMKANKEVIITYFWGGIGFWTASKIISYINIFMRDYFMEGF